MAVPRAYHSATLLNNGHVLVAGGNNGRPNYLTASAELYNPANGTWMLTGSMTTARLLHTATLLPNGQVLVTGGSGASGILSSAELYNPNTGNWAVAASMDSARKYQTATLLANGSVLVAGGQNSSGVLSSAELYTLSSLPLSYLTPANGFISTVAGNYGEPSTVAYGGDVSSSPIGDGSLATSYVGGQYNPLWIPEAVAVDASNNLFIADSSNCRIRKVDATNGIINTIVFNGSATGWDTINSVAVDNSSNVFFSSQGCWPSRADDPLGYAIVSEQEPNGNLITIVDGYQFGEDNTAAPADCFGLALNAVNNLYGALHVWVDGNGYDAAVYQFPSFALVANHIPYSAPYPPGGPGPSYIAESVAVDNSGNVYVADGAENQVLKISTNGAVTVVAGNGTLNHPQGVAVDVYGDVFIADTGNKVIRMVNTNGIMSTVAGGGTVGDNNPFYNGPATNVSLDNPVGVAVDPASFSLFIVDAIPGSIDNGGAVRKVTVNHGN
jgi:hypothetical protein